ncbi:MAG: hypothetical protein E7300_00690 [Lachnospiraceae bacterium]|nr:hypothetical protein [Lachnospiraceae bacterium]
MNDINHIITIAFAVCYYAVSLFLVRKTRFTTRNLCLCGIVIAMTIILDAIRIPLPTGATMALGSPIPLMLLATVTDYRHAIISGWVVGILVMFLNPIWYPVHWGQFFVEHMIVFSCLGFTGVFGTDKRYKILCGMALASVLKIIGHTLSGVLFFSQNAWAGWDAWGYSLAYNFSQNIPLCLLSAFIVVILPLRTIRVVTAEGR